MSTDDAYEFRPKHDKPRKKGKLCKLCICLYWTWVRKGKDTLTLQTWTQHTHTKTVSTYFPFFFGSTDFRNIALHFELDWLLQTIMLYDKWKTSTDIHMDEVWFFLLLFWFGLKQSSQQTFYIFNSLSYTDWVCRTRMNSAKFTEFERVSLCLLRCYVFWCVRVSGRARPFFSFSLLLSRTFARIKWIWRCWRKCTRDTD